MKKVLSAFAIVSLLYTPFAAAFQQFSDFYFFGDSLSDVGNEPGRTNRNNGQFWSEMMGAAYGKSVKASKDGGHDWAHSGARTYDKDGIDGLQKQVSQAIAAGPLNSRALYSVWVGANDINRFFEEAADLHTITKETHANIINAVQHLHNAGARYIMVFNLPDLAKTPMFKELGLPEEAAEEFSQFMRYYNAGLSAKLNQLGFKIIQIDTYSLLQAVVANPTKYGFSNATERYKTGRVGMPNLNEVKDPDKYLFHDDRHPTEAGNKLIFDAIMSKFAGAANATVLQDAPLRVMSNTHSGLSNELASIRTGSGKFTAGRGYRTFVTGSFVPTVYSADAAGTTRLANYRQSDTGVTVGVDYRWAKNIILGAALSHSFTTVKFGDSGGDVKMNENLFSVFSSYKRGKGYINGMADVGLVDYRMNRNIRLYQSLDVATSRTTATHWGGQLELGYNLFNKQIKSGPFMTAAYQNINVEPFAEDGATPGTNLQYYRMANDSLITGLGWQITASALWKNRSITPYAQLSYNKEWLKKKDVVNGIREIDVGTTSIGDRGGIPVAEIDTRGWILANLGINAQLAKDLYGSLSLQGTFLKKPYRSYVVMAGVQVPF